MGEGGDGAGQRVKGGCGVSGFGFRWKRRADGEAEGREVREVGEGAEDGQGGGAGAGARVRQHGRVEGGEGGVLAEGVVEEGRGAGVLDDASDQECTQGGAVRRRASQSGQEREEHLAKAPEAERVGGGHEHACVRLHGMLCRVWMDMHGWTCMDDR